MAERSIWRRASSGLTVACFALLTLAACSRADPGFVLQNISGLVPRLALRMTDQDGRWVDASDYRGGPVLLYFGYTRCPDACPITLTNLARALREVGTPAFKVHVLFVTVDPARDSAAILKQYLSAFGAWFVGLRGDDAELTALTKRYRVAYHREAADKNGEYAVDHSSAVFVFDRDGKPRLLAGASDTPDAIAHDLRRLLRPG